MTTETLSREWLQHQISAIEGAGITDSNTLAAFKLALAAMSSKPVVADEVEHVAAVLELIGSFEATDIDSDTVDLRFEIADVDTGSDVSITEYAARGSAIIRMLTGISSELPDGYVLEALKNTQTENELARGQLVILQRTLLNQQRKIAELESRTVKLPKPKDSDPGWKIDPEFISKVQNAIGYDDQCECWEGTPSMEVVEAVLLAAAGIKMEVE
jgi:dUTPase